MGVRNAHKDFMHIGQMIRNVLREKGMTVVSFAKQLSCTRENAHRILNKENIDIELLIRICNILDYDFFLKISSCNHFGHSDQDNHTYF